MVIRETPATSVRPTVSDSLLNARRRKTRATRLRTPGLSSTRATNVCSMKTPNFQRPTPNQPALGVGNWELGVDSNLIRGGFDQHGLLRPANHRVEVVASRYHRVHAVLLLDAEIDQDCSLRVASAFYDIRNFGALLGAEAQEAVRFGELDEVGAAQRRGRVAPFIEELLPLPDHAE